MSTHDAASATPGGTEPETGFSRGCHVVAVAVTLVWFLVYNSARPDYFVDEPGHMGNIYHFLEGKPGLPSQMTMLPGYHFIVAGLWQLHPPCTLLTLARLVTALTALLALGAFAVAWRRFHGRPSGPATLLLALLPLVQPFTGMVYTDVPAMAFVLCLWWAHLAGHRRLAACLAVAACCIRQTNLVWVGFIVLWEALRASFPESPPASGEAPGWKAFLSRTRWLFAVLAVATAIVVMAGRLTVGRESGNELRPNVATLHLAGVLTTLFFLPLLPAFLGRIPAGARRVWQRRPGRLAAGAVVAFAMVALLALTYSNPHEWNRALSWPGETFTLLRNWPLVWIDRYPVLRFASAVNLVFLALWLVAVVRRQRHGRDLALALLVGCVPAACSLLVEPRYLIMPLVFALFFVQLDRRRFLWLAGWFGLLSATHAPFIAMRLSLW